MKEFTFALLCCVLILLLPTHFESSPRISRPTEFWSLEKLNAASDIAFIGKLSATKADVGEVPPELRGAVSAEILKFEVLYKLKGSTSGIVDVVNYKPNKSELVSYCPNLFVIDKSLTMYEDLNRKLVDCSGKRYDSNAYMVFLKKELDGRLTPVTGFLNARCSYVDLWLPPEK